MTTYSKERVALDLGERIKEVRLERGLNQAEFAAQLGVSRSYLSEAERGKGKPSVEMLVGIATEYPEVSLRWLLTGSEAEPQHLSHPDLDQALLEIAAYKTDKWFKETGISMAADNLFLGLSRSYREVLETFSAFRGQGIAREKIVAALRRMEGMPDDQTSVEPGNGSHQ